MPFPFREIQKYYELKTDFGLSVWDELCMQCIERYLASTYNCWLLSLILPLGNKLDFLWEKWKLHEPLGWRKVEFFPCFSSNWNITLPYQLMYSLCPQTGNILFREGLCPAYLWVPITSIVSTTRYALNKRWLNKLNGGAGKNLSCCLRSSPEPSIMTKNDSLIESCFPVEERERRGTRRWLMSTSSLLALPTGTFCHKNEGIWNPANILIHYWGWLDACQLYCLDTQTLSFSICASMWGRVTRSCL